MIERSKIKTISLAIIIFTLFAAVSFFLTRSAISRLKEMSVKDEIAGANYCAATSDCAVVVSRCPFGCYVGVNKKEAGRIEDLINEYQSNCVYGCVALKGVDCVSGKCVLKY